MLYFKEERVCIVTGVLRDKDYTHIAKMLSTVSQRAFTFTPDSPRALDASDYAATLSSQGLDATCCSSVAEAIAGAKEYARKNNCAVVCAGSLYAIYNGYADKEILSFANLVAISCLSAPDSVSGILPKDKLEELKNSL